MTPPTQSFGIYVFDAYGTLFDVHAAIARHRAACGPDADRLSELWRTKQLEYSWTLTLAGHYEDFWTLTERALDHALARLPSVPAAVRPKLLDAYFTLDAFPDSAPCLAALKSRGARTAILSNGSPRMLSAAVAGAKLEKLLDAVLSVDAIRRYKPRPEVYAMVTDRWNVPAREVAFVSSNRWDVMGAAAFGFAAIWVNRAKLPDEYPGQAPLAAIGSLAALPELAR
jgi:2-haloacid dehalogenase